ARERDTLYHDELSQEYRPVYFHQFASHAARHGLQYLGEAEFHQMNDAILPAEAVESLRKLGPDQIVQKEQYMDILRCRSFRQTLLCRREIPLRRVIDAAIVERFQIESRAEPLGREPGADEEVAYRLPKSGSMTTKDPILKRMMARLERAQPRTVPFADLLGDDLTPAALAEFVLRLYGSTVVDLRLHAPSVAAEPGERPEASRLARVQLERHAVATNLRHEDVRFEDAAIR